LGVFENRMLRRICERKRDEVTGGRRRLHNEELHNMYNTSHIIDLLRRMGWMEHATCMREMRNSYKILFRKPEEKIQLGDQGGRIILKCVLRK
jgi:hypothetical protein